MQKPFPSYISQVICIRTHAKDDDVRHKSKDIETAFRGVIDQQSKQTNVPADFPPEIPRVLMQSGSKNISVSLVNCQLTMSFDSSTDLQKALGIAEKNLRQFWSGYNQLVPKESRRHSGIVVTANKPSKDEIRVIATELHGRLVKVSPLGEVASCEVRLGYRQPSGLFNNFSVTSYEIREQLVEEMKKGYVDMDSVPVKEWGYELKFDVNSRSVAGTELATNDTAIDPLLADLKALIFNKSLAVNDLVES